jgi:hypothetical protein
MAIWNSGSALLALDLYQVLGTDILLLDLTNVPAVGLLDLQMGGPGGMGGMP